MEVLPTEVIDDVCSRLNDVDLRKFMETSKTNYNLCLHEWNKREQTRVHEREMMEDEEIKKPKTKYYISPKGNKIYIRPDVKGPFTSVTGVAYYIDSQGRKVYVPSIFRS